jgi:hypothetical protein
MQCDIAAHTSELSRGILCDLGDLDPYADWIVCNFGSDLTVSRAGLWQRSAAALCHSIATGHLEDHLSRTIDQWRCITGSTMLHVCCQGLP